MFAASLTTPPPIPSSVSSDIAYDGMLETFTEATANAATAPPPTSTTPPPLPLSPPPQSSSSHIAYMDMLDKGVSITFIEAKMAQNGVSAELRKHFLSKIKESMQSETSETSEASSLDDDAADDTVGKEAGEGERDGRLGGRVAGWPCGLSVVLSGLVALGLGGAGWLRR